MAKKNIYPDAPKPDWQVTFVTLKIQGEDKDAFRKWMERQGEETALDVASFMSSGHKTSITWDNSNTCWIVSATCKEEKSANYNCCLSSRSSEWYEAMCMNVFKHNVLCNKGAWQDNEQSADWG